MPCWRPALPAPESCRASEALAELARRYFTSRGPATAQDFSRWSGLTLADARQGLEMAGDQLQQEAIDGQIYWFSPSLPARREPAPKAHLLSVYDEYLSGYKDRSAIVQARDAAELTAMGNALTNVLIVGGQIVGTWKRRLSKTSASAEMSLFRPLDPAEVRAVQAAARDYSQFLGRPVELVGQGW